MLLINISLQANYINKNNSLIFMKMKTYFLLSAIFLFITSCSHNTIIDSDDSTNGNDVEVKFTGEITESTTKTYQNSFTTSDTIGIYDYEEGKYISSNVPYTYQSDNTFSAIEEHIRFSLVNQQTTFLAYYPYVDDEQIVNHQIAIDATDQSLINQSKIDVLYARAKGSVKKPTVKLKFKHVMSQLFFVFHPSEGISLDEMASSEMNFMIDDFVFSGIFDLSTGLVQVAPQAKPTHGYVVSDAVAPNDDAKNNTRTYKLLVVPQELESFNLSFKVGARQCEAAINVPKDDQGVSRFEGGCYYTIHVRMASEDSRVNHISASVSQPVTLSTYALEGIK